MEGIAWENPQQAGSYTSIHKLPCEQPGCSNDTAPVGVIAPGVTFSHRGLWRHDDMRLTEAPARTCHCFSYRISGRMFWKTTMPLDTKLDGGPLDFPQALALRLNTIGKPTQ